MALNKRRVFIAAGVLTTVSIGAVVVYGLRLGGKQQAATLAASAERYLGAAEYASARIEADKLLLVDPDNGYGHFLRSRALLGKRDPARIGPADSDGLEAIRGLLRATAKDPTLVDPHKLLVAYFLGKGDATEAANHARAVVKSDHENLDARFAIAQEHLERKEAEEARDHVELLLTKEIPIRPRTAWLAVRVGTLLGRQSNLPSRVEAILKPDQRKSATDWPAPQDQLALVELHAWRARSTDDPRLIDSELSAALASLTKMVRDPALTDLPPRLLLSAAGRLIPPIATRSPATTKVYAHLESGVEALVEETLARAIETKVLDPSIYIELATRLWRRGKVDEAVGKVEAGIEIAKATGPEIRLAFNLCDLWLAEHYLSSRQSEKAGAYIEALLANPQYQPYGQLLEGYRLLQHGQVDQAAAALAKATAKLPENGTACALYGLCQLRRGFLSEGRQNLERGIRLGANQPQYRAWLALALAEAGYNDQAVNLAQQVLADPDAKDFGRALLGQLRLRAGQFDLAEVDFAAAVRTADAALKPTLLLAQAELAIARNQNDAAQKLLAGLKQTALAPQAYAAEYRQLSRLKRGAEADKALAEARARFPDNNLLLALEVTRMTRAGQQAAAVALLEAECRRRPDTFVPLLFLAEIHEQTNDYEKAVAILRQATEKFPDETALKVRLAERLLSQRNFNESSKLLADLKGNASVNPSTLDYLLARSAYLQGYVAKADEIIQRAAAKDPDNPTLKFLLGQLEMRKGNYASASELFEQTLAGGDYRQPTLRAFFESLLRTGETGRAIDLLGQAERRGAEVGSLRSRLLRLLATREQWDLLQNEIQEMLQHDPADSDLALAAAMLRVMKKPDDAFQLLETSLQRHPGSLILNEQRVALLLEQKKYGKADEALTTLLAKYAENPTLHLLRVQSLVDQNKLHEAQEAAAEGWRRCPGHDALVAIGVQVWLRQNQAAKALDLAAEAKKQHPSLPTPKYLVARAYETIGRRQEALDLLTNAVAEEPANQDVVHHYLRLLIDSGQTGNLLDTLVKLLAADPKNPLLLGVLAEYHAGRNDLQQTQAALDKLEQLQTMGPLVDYLRGVVAFGRQDYAAAEKSLNVALADTRGHVPSAFLFARIRARQKRYDEALDWIGRVRRQRPTLVAACQLHAQLLMQQSKWAEAETVCRDFLKTDANARPIAAMLANVLMQRGGMAQKAEALTIAQAALERGAENANEFEQFLRILFDAGSRAAALKLIDEKAVAPGKTPLIVAAGTACFAAGETGDAARLAQTVLDKDSGCVPARLLLADSQIRLAKKTKDQSGFEQAAENYRLVLQADPGNLAAANNLAWTLGVHMGKAHRAMEELQTVLPLVKSPSAQLPPELLDTVGNLHLQMDHLGEAQAFLEAALARKPDSAVTHYHLGQVYLKQNRRDRAQRSFDESLRLQPQAEWANQIKDKLSAN